MPWEARQAFRNNQPLSKPLTLLWRCEPGTVCPAGDSFYSKKTTCEIRREGLLRGNMWAGPKEWIVCQVVKESGEQYPRWRGQHEERYRPGVDWCDWRVWRAEGNRGKWGRRSKVANRSGRASSLMRKNLVFKQQASINSFESRGETQLF